MHERSFTVTADYIHKHKTPRGAWTRAQIEALGLDWPATQGWIDRLVGTEISFEQCQSFEVGKHQKKKQGTLRSDIMYRVKRLSLAELKLIEGFLDSI